MATRYTPISEYSKCADALVESIVNLLSKRYSYAHVREDILDIRGDGEWKDVFVSSTHPSVELHRKLSGSFEAVASEFKKFHPDEKVNKAPGMPRYKQCIKELVAAFKVSEREDQKRSAPVANTDPLNTLPKVGGMGYAPSETNVPAATGHSLQAAAVIADSAGDVQGAKRARSELKKVQTAAGKSTGQQEIQNRLQGIQQRLAAARAAGDIGAVIVAQGDIAEAYERIGDWPQAVVELRKLIVAQKRVPDRVYAFQARARLAKALGATSEPRDTAEAYGLLLDLHSGENWEQARALDAKFTARVAEWLAGRQMERRELAAAAASLNVAAALRQAIGNPVGMGSISLYRANLALREGSWSRAYRAVGECAQHWEPLKIPELSGRILLRQAACMYAEYRAKYDHKKPSTPEASQLLKKCLKAVSDGLNKLDGRPLSVDSPAEQAHGLQLRATLKMLTDENSARGRAAAAKDYQQSLKVCFDSVVLGTAHRALADIASVDKQGAVAAEHAAFALKYLTRSGTLSREDAKRLKALASGGAAA